MVSSGDEKDYSLICRGVGEALIAASLGAVRHSCEPGLLPDELPPLDRSDWGGPIGARDAAVARLAGVILNPGWLTAGLLAIALGRAVTFGATSRCSTELGNPTWRWSRHGYAKNEPRNEGRIFSSDSSAVLRVTPSK